MTDRLSHPDFVDLTREDLTDMEFHFFRNGLEEMVNRKQHLTKSQNEILSDIYVAAKKLLEGIH